jgi:hypothetical protein
VKIQIEEMQEPVACWKNAKDELTRIELVRLSQSLTSLATSFKIVSQPSPGCGVSLMTIRFDCPVCGHSLKCADEVAGKRVQCTRFAAITTAPVPITHPEIVTNDEPPTVAPQPKAEPARTNIVTTTAAPSPAPPAPSTWQAVEQPTLDGSITAATPVLSARAQVIHPYERDDEDDDHEPRRRNYRSRRHRNEGGFRCPYCGTDEIPLRQSKISTAGWIVFAVLLLLFWPLFFTGLLMKEEHKVCAECGMKLN